jgi:hypothetical protein
MIHAARYVECSVSAHAWCAKAAYCTETRPTQHTVWWIAIAADPDRTSVAGDRGRTCTIIPCRTNTSTRQVKAYGRHRLVATVLEYYDEHDRQGTHRTIADLVSKTLTA